MKKRELLKRKQLAGIMSMIYHYPLTIVEAPIGFGKTTAVRSFLKEDKNDPLWITILNSKEATALFWDTFTSQLSRLEVNTSHRLKTLGFPSDIAQIEKVLSLLININYPPKTVLVIDDFHLIPDINISRLLLRIAQEQLDNLHLVIITRDTTQLEFSELLSKGLCHIISHSKLKFSEAEITAYCRMMQGGISDTDIRRICDYSDGWVSLIYLILLALENGVEVGMNAFIDDLVERVLYHPYEEAIRRFLLKLSFMDVFSNKQALYVTGEERTPDILKQLRRENAFVYYDLASHTYKIHNVLLDFLRLKRELILTEDELRDIYIRLGEWELANNNFTAAYRYFYKAGEVVRILTHLNEPANISNELTSFEGSKELFGRADKKLLYQYPLAYLQHILLSIVRGDQKDIADCAALLDDLRKAYEEMDAVDEDFRNHIIAEALIFKRFTSFNVINPSEETNTQILRLLNGKQSYIMTRNNEFTMGSPHLLYVYFRDQGTFRQLTQLAIERFTSYASFANGCGTGSEYVIKAEFALETGDWATAELSSFKAIYKASAKDQISIILCANFTLIRLYLLQGKLSEAVEMLKQLEDSISSHDSPLLNTTVDMCKGYVYACLEQHEKIPLWLQIGDMTSASFLYQGIAFNYIVYGKAILLSKNYKALDALTEVFHEQFCIFHNQLGFLHNQIFKAIASYHLYGMEEGVHELEQALTMARSDNILLPLIEYAPQIIGMLRILVNRASQDEYLKTVVIYCEQYIDNLRRNSPSKISLTDREAEVLSLTAEGFNREEIAERLTLSQGTVKTHLHNIYLKLDASGKVSAIKIAQMNGLI